MSQSINFHDDAFTNEYDKLCHQAIPGYEFAIELAGIYLGQYLSDQADILIVGAGTGNELIQFSQGHPQWNFSAIDISEEMLNSIRRKLTALDLMERITLYQSKFEELQLNQTFDAASCSLVLDHIIGHSKKIDFLKKIYQHLKPSGILIYIDYFIEENPAENILQQKVWKAHAISHGASAQFANEALQYGAERMDFTTAKKALELLQSSGFAEPILFFAANSYRGYILQKF